MSIVLQTVSYAFHFIRSGSSWLRVTPFGIRKVLRWIKEKYGDVPIYITENGFSDNGALEDTDRVNYYNQYINNVLKGNRKVIVDLMTFK